MALAIDSSTPAPDNVTRSTAAITTTNTFSPPAGSVIFLFISGTGPSPAATQTVTGVSDNLGVHLGWALFTGSRDNVQSGILLGGNTEVWWAACPSAQSNMTVTVTFNSANSSSSSNPAGMIQPIVFTGAATTQNGNASIRNSTASATPSQTLVTSAANSWVFGIVQNFTNGTGPTAGASQTNTIDGTSSIVLNASDGDAFWVQTTNSTTSSSGTTVTLNDTAPTTIAHHFSMVEVLAASTGGMIPLQWIAGG